MVSENDDASITMVYWAAGVPTFIFSCIIFTAVRRTRRIPYASRLLSTGLLIFDMLFIIAALARNLTISVPIVNLQLNVTKMIAVQLAYSTVALMSLERFIVIAWPNFYLRYGSKRRIRLNVFIIWSCVVVLFLMVRYGICPITNDLYDVIATAGTCHQVVTVFYSGLVGSALCTSFVSYIKIFRVIRNQSGDQCTSYKSAASILKKYKSTSVVILYILTISLTSFAYAVVIVLIRRNIIDPSMIRTLTDSIHFVNCIVDPFLYALWFRESRMECLKLVAPFSGRLQQKIETMRIEVFSIVITTTKSSTSGITVSSEPGSIPDSVRRY